MAKKARTEKREGKVFLPHGWEKLALEWIPWKKKLEKRGRGRQEGVRGGGGGSLREKREH